MPFIAVQSSATYSPQCNVPTRRRGSSASSNSTTSAAVMQLPSISSLMIDAAVEDKEVYFSIYTTSQFSSPARRSRETRRFLAKRRFSEFVALQREVIAICSAFGGKDGEMLKFVIKQSAFPSKSVFESRFSQSVMKKREELFQEWLNNVVRWSTTSEMFDLKLRARLFTSVETFLHLNGSRVVRVSSSPPPYIPRPSLTSSRERALTSLSTISEQDNESTTHSSSMSVAEPIRTYYR